MTKNNSNKIVLPKQFCSNYHSPKHIAPCQPDNLQFLFGKKIQKIDDNIIVHSFNISRQSKTRPTMTLTQQRKQELMAEYQVHETDTGSADLQIAVLTERINKLTAHLKANKKDHSSRRGLLKMIGRRKGLLAYIQKEDYERYQKLIGRLGIRR